MIHMLSFKIYIVILPLLLAGFSLHAQERREEGETPEITPFAESYIYAGMARNSPMSFTQNRFDSGYLHPIIGYRHSVADRWIMGVSSQFKVFYRKNTDEEKHNVLAFWTISHESYFALRLYHPFYLLTGPKLLYLLPTRNTSFPLQKESEFETEIGVAVSAAIAYVTSNKHLLMFRTESWRGTKTTRFQGIEASLEFSYAMK
jgi:hypothetical protein